MAKVTFRIAPYIKKIPTQKLIEFSFYCSRFMDSSQRIVFNTGITYLRFVITIFLAFYTTRITLQVLGVKDFGLYSVIGGIVAMVAFMNTALAQATQRFLSYHIGSKNIAEVKKVFANSILIHAALAIILFFGLEIIGIYYVNHVLNVDPERLTSANYLLQFSIIATLLTIISVPYDALLFAHENMLFIAIVNLFDAVMKLFIALALLYIDEISVDKLILYGFLLMMVSLSNRIIMQVYVRKKYKETNVSNVFKEFDRKKIKEQTSFAGWNLLHVVGFVARNSGLALVINSFMGTRINASYAIGNQVSSQARFFSNTLLQAINPQIIKNEGGNNRKSMVRLSLLGSRYGTLLICLCAIPIIFHINTILEFWLKEIPDFTAMIAVMMLIAVILNQLTSGIETMVYAVGDIKNYSIILSSIKIAAIPFAILIFYLDFENSLFLVFCMLVIIELLTFIARILYVKFKKLIQIVDYFKLVLNRILIPIIIYCIFNYGIFSFTKDVFIKLVLIILGACIYLISIYHITLERESKQSFVNMLKIPFKKRKKSNK